MHKTVLAIPDMHLPWTDWKSVEKIYSIIEETKPHLVIQLGDLYDFFAYSKYARSLDVCTPKEEVSEARQGAENLWKTIGKLLPRTGRRIQLLGNHDQRLAKRAAERFPEIITVLRQQSLWEFPGVESFSDAADFFEFQDVIYTHGYLTQLGAHCKHFLQSVVHGHSHRRGIIFFNTRKGTIFEVDSGHVADETAVPLQYGSVKHNHWGKGCTVVDKYGPKVIAL